MDTEDGEDIVYKDRLFKDLAGYAEEIYVQYEGGPVRLFTGKFNPTFGQAWAKAPSVYGTDFAEGYQLTERIDLGGAVSAESEGLGKHNATTSTKRSVTPPALAHSGNRKVNSFPVLFLC